VNDACPQDEVLERLLDGELSADEERVLESHLVACEECRKRLDRLTSFAGAIQTRVSVRVDDDAAAAGRGVLARLADSSKPVLRIPTGKQPARKRPSDSFARRLASSAHVSRWPGLIRHQYWTWPLIAAALFGAAAWWVANSVETAMREQREDSLKTVLEADITALREWMEHKRSAAEIVAANERLRPMVEELSELTREPAELRSRLLRAESQAAIRSNLLEPQKQGRFVGFLLVSREGLVLAADDDAAVGAVLSAYSRAFFASMIDEQGAVSKPFLSPLPLSDDEGTLQANLPCMYAAAPLRDAGGEPIAALGLRIRPDDEFSRILRVARSGKSGETYAFDRDGVLLSESRFDDHLKQIGLVVDQPGGRSILNVELRDPGVNMVDGERPQARRKDQPLTRMAEAAVQGTGGVDADGYNDYRGVPVVGAWRWLDEYDFGVATELDLHEAFAPLYVLRRAIGVLVALLIAAAIGMFLAMRLIARQQRQLHDATLAAQQLGQYTLVEKLGSGGMGTVYKARHALLRRPTAVKVLNPKIVSDTAIARFEREVQLTSGLTHPNTVAIYDFGRTAEGVFYYAMEYLEGTNLDVLVKEHGALPEARALYILRQICASLAEAHAAGLIHRDVKPANVFLTFRGGQYDFVKVLDFGLAKLAGDQRQANLTSTDTVAGTPLYVSPEAITQPEQIDARADVYGIGAVGYYLLTGTPVFTGSSATDICLKHVRSTPEPPSARTGHAVSAAVEALLLRCLAKSPDARPGNAAELLALLQACPVSGSWTVADAALWWKARQPDRSPSVPDHNRASNTPSARQPPTAQDSNETPQNNGQTANDGIQVSQKST
jgi:serine/threonine protein kinase